MIRAARTVPAADLAVGSVHRLGFTARKTNSAWKIALFPVAMEDARAKSCLRQQGHDLSTVMQSKVVEFLAATIQLA